jgi:hypothetical protein
MGSDELVTGCKHHFSPATLGKLRHFPVPSLSKCHQGTQGIVYSILLATLMRDYTKVHRKQSSYRKVLVPIGA